MRIDELGTKYIDGNPEEMLIVEYFSKQDLSMHKGQAG